MTKRSPSRSGKPDEVGKPPKSCAPFYNPKDPEAQFRDWETHGRLAQAIFALGVGAGPIRISAGALLWYYQRLWPHFYKQASPDLRALWLDEHDAPGQQLKASDCKNEAPQVLDLSRSVGKLAAQIATDDVSFTIKKEHLSAAMDAFAHSYLPAVPAGRGHYCTNGRKLTHRRGRR